MKKEQVALDIEDFFNWILETEEKNTTLSVDFLKKTYSKCFEALMMVPKQLDLDLSEDERDVFKCKTPSELKSLLEKFQTAPNYSYLETNPISNFAKGVGLLEKYLQDCHKSIDIDTTQSVSILPEEIRTILTKKFKGGLRLDFLELRKFRNHYADIYKQNINISDDKLKGTLISCGLCYCNTVYIVPIGAIKRIKKITKQQFKDGRKIIYFEEFYDKNRIWLYENSIIDTGMLKLLCQQIYPKLYFRKLYFGKTKKGENDAITAEIFNALPESNEIIRYEQIAQQLTYIPESKIRKAIRDSDDFIKNDLNTYVKLTAIELTPEEKKIICDKATNNCRDYGYIAVEDLPIDSIKTRYNQLSKTAIQNAVYVDCLSKKYEKRGKIIYPKGHKLKIEDIVGNYCKDKEKCSFREILEIYRELTRGIGGYDRPLKIAYSNLVRISKDSFVNEKQVFFDIETIDNEIAKVIIGEYLTLKSFTTFRLFPSCGYAWNLYLLENYCYRFSRLFKLANPVFNSQNAGVVMYRNCKMNYFEIMADAVWKANTPLEKDKVNNFLFENGYIGKKTTAETDKIIAQVKLLKMRNAE
jgi:hypothetical protein